MSIESLITNPVVFSTLLGGATWLVNKILGRRADTKAAKVGTAIGTASALMLQYTLTEKDKTPEQVIIAFKGIVAIELAKVGVYEKDRAPYQFLIDIAIAKAVTHWVTSHPAPQSLTMPVAKKVA
jgi:hypothetical protein